MMHHFLLQEFYGISYKKYWYKLFSLKVERHRNLKLNYGTITLIPTEARANKILMSSFTLVSKQLSKFLKITPFLPNYKEPLLMSSFTKQQPLAHFQRTTIFRIVAVMGEPAPSSSYGKSNVQCSRVL